MKNLNLTEKPIDIFTFNQFNYTLKEVYYRILGFSSVLFILTIIFSYFSVSTIITLVPISLAVMIPFAFSVWIHQSFDKYCKTMNLSGFIALIDFFSIVSAEKNFFTACKYIASGDYEIISNIFQKSIRESRISKNRLEDLLVNNFDRFLFHDAKKYWKKSVILWKKDSNIIESFIKAISLKIDEYFTEELKLLETRSSVFIAIGTILPPTIVILMLLSGNITIYQVLIVSLSLSLIAYFFSPFKSSNRVFVAKNFDNSIFKGSELTRILSEELKTGSNFRKAVIKLLDSSIIIENSNEKLNKYKNELGFGKPISKKLCNRLGEGLTPVYGSIILTITHKLVKHSRKSALLFLNNFQVALEKRESFYSKRKSVFVNEKRRMFVSISFSSFSLGLSSVVMPIFHAFSIFSSNSFDEIVSNNWLYEMGKNIDLLLLFPIVFVSSFFLLGYDNFDFKNFIRQDSIRKNMPLMLVIYIIYFMAGYFGQLFI